MRLSSHISTFAFVLLSKRILAQVLPPIPSSPFGDPNLICQSEDGVTVNVGGFTSSPFKITPFVDTFTVPPVANYKNKVCRDDGHCILSYDMIINQIQLRPFDNSIPGCKDFPGTWFLSYNG